MNGLKSAIALSRTGTRDPWICSSCRAKAFRRTRLDSHTARWKSSSAQIPVTVAVEDHGPYHNAVEQGQSLGILPHEHPLRPPIPESRELSTPSVPVDVTLQSLLILQKQHKFLQIGSKSNREQDLYETIQNGRPADIAFKLAEASQDEDLLRSIPGTTWTEIIRQLNPKTWTPQVRGVHRSVNVERLFAGTSLSPSASVRNHKRILSEVTRVRRGAGLRLGLADYRLLLEYAGRMSSFRMAKDLWEDMNADGVRPDIECYNALMEASLYDSKQRLRLLRGASPNRDNAGEGHQLWKSGIFSTVEHVFERMKADAEVEPDTRSCCAVLTAMSRDHKTTSMADTLKRLWNLDVRAMANGEALEPPKRYPRGHRLYPNSRLLVTIADTFGVHGGISMAMRLIDTISRHYDVPVKRNVWHQLLMWTWIHARASSRSLLASRAGDAKARIRNTDDVPEEEQLKLTTREEDKDQRRGLFWRFQSLFDTMLSSSNGRMTPSLHVLHMATTNGLRLHASGSFSFTQPAVVGKLMLSRIVQLQRSARQSALELFVHERQTGEPRSPKSPAKLHRHLDESTMDRRIAISYLQRWSRHVLESGMPDSLVENRCAEDRDIIEEWRLRGLPSFLLQWRSFAPSSIRYQVPSGIVELRHRSADEIVASRTTRQRRAKEPRRLRWLRLKNNQQMTKRLLRQNSMPQEWIPSFPTNARENPLSRTNRGAKTRPQEYRGSQSQEVHGQQGQEDRGSMASDLFEEADGPDTAPDVDESDSGEGYWYYDEAQTKLA